MLTVVRDGVVLASSAITTAVSSLLWCVMAIVIGAVGALRLHS